MKKTAIKIKRRQRVLPFPLPCFVAELRTAIRNGTKQRTRRVCMPQPPREDPQPPLNGLYDRNDAFPWPMERDGRRARCGQIGQTHYLREPLVKTKATAFDASGKGYVAAYRDDGKQVMHKGKPVKWRWKRKVLPQIHMPRIYSRTLVVLTVKRGEWLHEITEEEAIDEGIYPKDIVRNWGSLKPPLATFRELWDSINNKGKRKHGWETNCFVNVIGFELIINNLQTIVKQ